MPVCGCVGTGGRLPVIALAPVRRVPFAPRLDPQGQAAVGVAMVWIS